MRARRIIVLSVSAVVLTTLGLVAWFVLWPSHGLELAKPGLEEHLNRAIAGELDVGSVESETLSTLRFHDVVLRDREGDPVLVLEALEATWRPWALLHERLHLDALTLRGARVLAEPPDVLDALAAREAEASDDTNDVGLPLAIRVDAFEVDGSYIPRASSHPFSARGSGRVSRHLSVDARGEIRHRDSFISVESFRWSPGGHGSFDAGGRLSAATLRERSPILCAAQVEIEGDGDGERWAVRGTATLGRSTAELDARLDVTRDDATLYATAHLDHGDTLRLRAQSARPASVWPIGFRVWSESLALGTLRHLGLDLPETLQGDLRAAIIGTTDGTRVDGRASASFSGSFRDQPWSAKLGANLSDRVVLVNASSDAPVNARIAGRWELPGPAVDAFTALDPRDIEIAAELGPVSERLVRETLSSDPASTGTFSELWNDDEARVSGRAQVWALYSEGRTQAWIGLRELRAPPVPRALTGGVWIESAGNTVARAYLRDGGRTVVGVTARTDGWRTLLDAPAAPNVSGRARLDGVSLDTLLGPGQLARSSAGWITGDGEFRFEDGSFSTDATAEIHGAVLAGAVARHARGELHYRGGQWSGSVDVENANEGRLQVDLNTKEATVTASRFPLDFSKRLAHALDVEQWIEGRLDAQLRVALDGTVPAVDGELALRADRVRMVDVLPPLTQLQARARLGNRDSFISLRSVAGDGALDFFAPGASLSSGSLDGELSFVRVPITVSRLAATASGSAEISLHLDEAVRVDTLLRSATLDVQRLDRQGLHSTEVPDDIVFVDPEAGRRRPDQDPTSDRPVRVSVATATPVEVRGDSVEADLMADFTYVLDSQGQTMNGTLSSGEHGSARVGPRRYAIDHAELDFRGRTPINPRIDLSLVHRFASPPTSFYVRVSGSAEAPEVDFASSPGIYDRPQLISFFLGGRPGQAAQGEIDRGAAATAFAGVLTQKLRTELNRGLPIDTLDVELGESGEPKSLTTGKWLTRDLFVAYALRSDASVESDVGTGTGPAHVGLLRYQLTPRWTLELEVDPGNEVAGAADLVWVRQF